MVSIHIGQAAENSTTVGVEARLTQEGLSGRDQSGVILDYLVPWRRSFTLVAILNIGGTESEN